ncbi:GNAT superfamily N-acetyltransferase [Rhizomicrobium palustre]|uniref:GNAT superfamily N-acetyltransferase n=1 Tax=Rhizomicrobium palustre TaxID=189966 RepID=A0A846N258_9PROT|nr:GNAT family N-acetyltransferase [Rhizomicrobium palustre]NIK89693.1 GNAT superfamily N-acetyltransferase [Rhizomicrobium palustre]
MCQIRKCSAADFERVVTLLRQLWPTKSLDQKRLKTVWDRALTNSSQHLICAIDGGDLVGFASMSIKNNLWAEGFLGHVDELIVTENSRGQGIGTALVEHLVGIAEQAGCVRLELDSAFHREEAHGFYESKGFKQRAYMFTRVL